MYFRSLSTAFYVMFIPTYDCKEEEAEKKKQKKKSMNIVVRSYTPFLLTHFSFMSIHFIPISLSLSFSLVGFHRSPEAIVIAIFLTKLN